MGFTEKVGQLVLCGIKLVLLLGRHNQKRYKSSWDDTIRDSTTASLSPSDYCRIRQPIRIDDGKAG